MSRKKITRSFPKKNGNSLAVLDLIFHRSKYG